MAAQAPATKTLSGCSGELALRSTLVFTTCGAAGSLPLRELLGSAVCLKLGSGIYRSGLESGPSPEAWLHDTAAAISGINL